MTVNVSASINILYIPNCAVKILAKVETFPSIFTYKVDLWAI